MANQPTCLRSWFEIQSDNIFASSFLGLLVVCSHRRQIQGKTDLPKWPALNYITPKTTQTSQIQRPESSLPLQYFPQDILFPSAIGFPVKSCSHGPGHQFSLEITRHLKNESQSVLFIVYLPDHVSLCWTLSPYHPPLMILFRIGNLSPQNEP